MADDGFRHTRQEQGSQENSREEHEWGPRARDYFIEKLKVFSGNSISGEDWYRSNRADILNSLVDVADWNTAEYHKLLIQLNSFTAHVVDLERIKADVEKLQRQKDDRDAFDSGQHDNTRHYKIVELQQEALDQIKEHLRPLGTQEDCWQYILDHSKAFIVPLAKLSIIEQASCDAITEKLLPMIGRKKTELTNMIKAEAKILRVEGFGNELTRSKDGLSRTSSGVPHSNFHNGDVILRKYLTGSVVGWDMFSNKIVWKLKPVWESEDKAPAMVGDAPGLGYREYHESDAVKAAAWLNQQGLDKASYDMARKLIRSIAYDFKLNSYHDYLSRYRGIWDGVDRLSEEFDLVKKLFGTKYRTRTERRICHKMLRKQLIGWMQRGLHPGCDFRTILHLIGDQRARKSTWVETLAGPYYVIYRRKNRDPHHSDNYMQMMGYTLGELAKSSQFKSWNYEVMKESLSTKKDNVRKPYAEDYVLMPRSWVLFGTSNNEREFLIDPTGNTRHFTIRVDWDFDAGETIPIEWFESEIRTQLLAQLIYLVEVDKEANYLDTEDSKLHKEYIRGFEVENDAAYIVEKALDDAAKLRPSVAITHYPGFRFDELYEALSFNRRKPPTKNEVANALNGLGLEDMEIPGIRKKRWFIKTTRKRKLDQTLKEEIADRTGIFPQQDSY